MMKKYKCEICYEDFSKKKDLVDDLKGHIDDATYDIDTAQSQLDELGVKNPYS